MVPIVVVVCGALVIASIVSIVTLQAVFSDYWNGTARASLIQKQTGIQYTWREAAQIKGDTDDE